MNRCWTLLSFTALVTMFPPQGLTSEPRPATNEEIQQAFDWFGGLDVPNIKTCAFVRVATGHWSQTADEPPTNLYAYGFLLSADDQRFSVWFPDLRQISFVRTSPDTPQHEAVSFEPSTLETFATQQLSLLSKPEDQKANLIRRFGERLSERGEVFSLAWACRQQGLESLALDLARQASQIPSRYDSPEKPATNLIDKLQCDFGYSVIWRDTLDFGQPSVRRPELLAKFQAFARNFPHSQYASNATATAAMLAQMISEDQAHAEAKHTAPPLDQLPMHERVAELIFQLRDQCGQQFSQPGWCDVFEDPRGEQSPASQLVAIGYGAVPQLIDALNNQRFTRSVGFHRNFYFSHYVLRVSDSALAVLQRIAGRTFYTPACTSCYWSRDGKPDDSTKEAVLAWWNEFQKNGEEQTWIRSVVRGDHDAPDIAARLLKKYPDDAIPSICRAIDNTSDSYVSSELIQLLGATNTATVTAFLTTQMRSNRLAAARVAAADVLWRQGAESALPAMIEEWTRPNERAKDSDGEDLIAFLVHCDRPAGIEALATNWKHQPKDTRIAVIESIIETLHNSESEDALTNAISDKSPVVTNATTLVAMENLLVSALADTDQRWQMTGRFYDLTYDDPRICDIAGFTLAHYWKNQYSFDPNAFLTTRERQRIACINHWRAAHNQKILPLPPTRHIQPADPKTIGPMLQQLRSATSTEQRAAALVQIETLGLPALPYLLETQRNVPEGDQALKAAVSHSANRLSRQIVNIQFSDQSSSSNDSFRNVVEAWKGKMFDADTFISSLLAFLKQPQADAMDIELTALRDESLTGMDLLVQFLPRPGHIHYDPAWSSHETIEVGQKLQDASFDGTYLGPTPQRAKFHDLVDDLNVALLAPPTLPVMIQVRICRDTELVDARKN